MSTAAPTIEFEPKHHRYTVNGEPFPSVTTVLGVLNKPALFNWAEWVTAGGAWRLARRKGYKLPDNPRQFLSDIKSHGLGAVATRDAAAIRGTAVHDALQAWAERQEVPSAPAYPENVQGYIRGLSKFLLERRPTFYESERPVASLTHRFVGTRDTVCTLDDPARGRCLLDLKTSKRIYPSMFCQVEAYELAGVEQGETPTDSRGIVRVGADGSYEIAWSCASAEDFLAVLACYRSQQALEARAKGGE